MTARHAIKELLCKLKHKGMITENEEASILLALARRSQKGEVV